MWFVNDIVNSIKKIPSAVEGLLSSEVTYTKPAPEMPPLPAEEPPKPDYPTLEGEFIGTNYDPYDPLQTKPEPDGIGASGVKMENNMVATAHSSDGVTGNLRLGTVIQIPELDNQVFLVADTMNKRFNGMNKIDFVDANSKGNPNPRYNQNFGDIKILREGKGRADAREFAVSDEWKELQKLHNQPKTEDSTKEDA